MSHALQLAKRGQYTCDPNPCVGCVITKENKILSEGWHAVAGESHAEINAINAVDNVADTTVYVTLEPCSHHGKTPPCVDALIKAGVSEVIIAMLDPNPEVAGSGIKQLEAAGIVVRQGLLEEQAKQLNPGFIKRMTQNRPYLRCKMAISTDGRTALANGVSQWISSAESRQDVHKLRAASSAIMSSAETIVKDNASLNPRNVTFEFKQPVRVIIDRELKIPVEARLFSIPGKIIIYTQAEDEAAINNIRSLGAELVILDESEDCLLDVLAHLAEVFEINDIMLEAGASLSGKLLEIGMVDELIIYVAPKLMGQYARPMFNLPEFEALEQIIQAEPVDIRQFGKDIRLTYKLH